MLRDPLSKKKKRDPLSPNVEPSLIDERMRLRRRWDLQKQNFPQDNSVEWPGKPRGQLRG